MSYCPSQWLLCCLPSHDLLTGSHASGPRDDGKRAWRGGGRVMPGGRVSALLLAGEEGRWEGLLLVVHRLYCLLSLVTSERWLRLSYGEGDMVLGR